MADEPEQPDDESVATEDETPEEQDDGAATRAAPDDTEASVLAELALCENLSQTSGWAARWSASMAGADGVLLWAPDTVHPLFLCIGAHGSGLERFLRRSVPRDEGLAHDLVRDRAAIALDHDEIAASQDPFLRGAPPSFQACLALPLQAEGIVVGLLALFFEHTTDADETLERIDGFLHHAAPALGRALRSERKTVGMLHAIERLTNLYDLSKAFGSTIDVGELSGLIVRKAADFVTAEAASLWLLERDGGEVTLGGTGVNENYDVHPPAAVGMTVIGDVIADQSTLRRNRIPEDDPLAGESEEYAIHSCLAVPLTEDEAIVGALILVNKRGRHPEFTAEDEELLQDLCRQAVRALRTARQHEAEKKVEELDALLAVSREITSTLDLDKVMHSVVNASSALIAYDRCAIAIQEKGRLRLGALSGAAEIDRKNPDTKRMDELLQWVFLSGSDAAVSQDEDGTITADRPETEEKFRAVFQETGLRSFFGVVLRDEEGKLGALAFESRQPFSFDEETKDLLSILVNQATVAVRNAQLYQQVPLAGFLKPLLEKRRKVAAVPMRRKRNLAIGALVAAVVLFVVPWPLRVAGPARVLPGRRAAVTSLVDGVIAEVYRREGDRVQAGEVIAALKPEPFEAALAQARSSLALAESDVAKARESADAAAVFDGESRKREAAAQIALASDRLARTQLAAPTAGIIVTPRIEERVGQHLARGAELCVVADLQSVTAEVAVPESDVALVRSGEKAALKFNPYPGRLFRGSVDRVGARLRQEGEDRFLIAEVSIPNADGALKTGMLGTGKVSVGTRSVFTALFRRPARYLWNKIWPILP
ncbi:MAG TPA: efflux RND transporter periplasmic adaptor subunit [Thermoanaerobaculia bacterium]